MWRCQGQKQEWKTKKTVNNWWDVSPSFFYERLEEVQQGPGSPSDNFIWMSSWDFHSSKKPWRHCVKLGSLNFLGENVPNPKKVVSWLSVRKSLIIVWWPKAFAECCINWALKKGVRCMIYIYLHNTLCIKREKDHMFNAFQTEDFFLSEKPSLTPLLISFRNLYQKWIPVKCT